MDAFVIELNGSKREVIPENGKDFTLAEMYRHIGCDTVQFLKTYDGRWLIVDEEGKLKYNVYNAVASLLYLNGMSDPIVGKALVCKPSMIK